MNNEGKTINEEQSESVPMPAIAVQHLIKAEAKRQDSQSDLKSAQESSSVDVPKQPFPDGGRNNHPNSKPSGSAIADILNGDNGVEVALIGGLVVFFLTALSIKAGYVPTFSLKDGASISFARMQ